MFKVEITGPSHAGIYPYACRAAGYEFVGRSRQPLLDACRQLERMGADPSRHAALFREGAGGEAWDLRCRVGVGADLTVADPPAGGMRFANYSTLDDTAFRKISARAVAEPV